ncbi:Eukaryotic peptide chain release factor GTP-binding subunit [Coniochaeta pulveracea]|uniref:Palmitoyltransferase n=1 Tax=Coniochaeta pulveracea TaxID=177199 RepID=A0A420XYE7_9PEZI|nr:Eukaryotic peptide chain release factor GTP-binding subunit [Coniochaeta pulveracea]
MTDIASEDGGERNLAGTAAPANSSLVTSDSPAGTARTSNPNRTAVQSQPLRRVISNKRKSLTPSTSEYVAGRPPSSASKSHVPSLTSHAFFRPMSSQKLQAQRGAGRPSTMSRPPMDGTNSSPAGSNTNTPRHSITQIARPTTDDSDGAAPPSRGTELTEQETYDRMTANTSPQGHYTQNSLSESVRPLQKQPAAARNLTVNVDKSYRNGGNMSNLPTPRSFRSNFLLPTRNDSQHSGENRDMRGGEKLDSVASSPQLTPTDAQPRVKLPESKPKDLGHNYEYFDGNLVFCFGGRFLNTRNRPINLATGAVVLIPAVLFFACQASWIWHNISPALPVTWAYVWLVTMSSLIHASASDPGILPRNLHQFPPPADDDLLALGPPTNDWTLVKSSEKTAAAMEVPTKYCKTCNIWRPPRAHHCRLCDNCIETQDHHCVWINNCVGRRNYRFFFAFVSGGMIAAAYLLGISLAQIIVYMNRENISFGAAISHFRVAFAMVIYGFISFLYPAALTGYHIFLMARGETTREYLNSHKFLKKDRYRAFTQGSWFKNWFVVLCRPRPPTYYQFKSKYMPGDQRLGADRNEPPSHEKEGGVEMQDMLDVKHAGTPDGRRPPPFEGPVSLRGTPPKTTPAS